MPDVGSGIAGGAAIVGGIGSLFGGGDDQAEAYSQAGALQAAAAKYAADLQYKAAKESNELIERMYQTGRTDLAPWRMTGQMALDIYSGLLGMPSIYTTQMPTIPGQNALAAGLTTGAAGTSGTTGTTGGTTTGAGGAAAFDYSPYGYQMGPGGQLTPIYQGDLASRVSFSQQYQQPQLVGFYGQQTPIYDIGGNLFYTPDMTGRPGLYNAFQQSIDDYNQRLEAYNQRKEIDTLGSPPIAPTYNPITNSFSYLPTAQDRAGGAVGMPTLSPYQGPTTGVTWIPGYTPATAGTTGTAGAAGTAAGTGVNALAPYDISMPSNRIDPTAWIQRTPGYQFQFQEGLNALDRSAAAKGMLLSGAQQKAATQYGQEYALSHYDNLMNRLASLAGIGQSSSATSGAQGLAAATRMGQNTMQAALNAAQARMAGAQAQASGYINAANVNAANQNAMWGNIGGLIGGVGGLIGNVFGGSQYTPSYNYGGFLESWY